MKRTINKSFLAFATVISLGITGCEKIKDFGDTNTNPNGTPAPVTAGLLTRSIAELGGREGGTSVATMTRPGYYAQYFSETQYPSASLYNLPQLEFSGNYSGFLYDLQNIINQNSDPATAEIVSISGSNANQIAVARILKAYAFWTITDRWGDVPYSEALKGNPVPKYDKQEDIYADILKELREAVDGFDNGIAIKGDVIYGGNNTKWQRFANSVRMQVALRMSKVYPAAGGLAATEFNAALNHSAGSIEVNGDNARINFPGGAYQNPWYVSYVVSSRIDDAVSSTMTDALADHNDPRINKYGSTTVGFPYGLNRAAAVAVAPGWGLVLAGNDIPANDPVVLMNAATVLFARAEAAQRGWTTENAADLYAEGIRASMSQWGYSGAAVETYINQASVRFDEGDPLERIGTQKWFALYPDGLQAWSEWRRTGFPVLTPAEFAENDTKEIPRRYVYGTGEYGTNNANVKAAAALLSGGDTQDARMWWDKE